MAASTDARGAIADVLGLDRSAIRCLGAGGEGNERIVLSQHQARHLAMLARAGKSWCQEQFLEEWVEGLRNA